MLFSVVILSFVVIFLSMRLLQYRHTMDDLEKQLTYKLKTQSKFLMTSSAKQKEIQKLEQTLNQMFVRLSENSLALAQKDQQMQRMLSGITHDIRTPLTSIQGYLTLLKESEGEEERSAYLEVISYRLQMLQGMLENIFMDAKLNDDDYRIDLEIRKPYPILCKVLASFYHDFHEKNMEPSIIFENQNIEVYANEELLTRVFQNLIHNALQHGYAYIKITQREHRICFINGILPTDDIDIDKIFDRFYVQDVSRSKGSSGLGLTIVDKMMKKMNGQIQAKKTNCECKFILDFDAVITCN